MKYFNGVELSEETILKTRKWFSVNALACIEEAKNGVFFVNDFEEYSKMENELANEYLEGKHDHVLAFLQRAYFIQTGESIPLLSNLNQ